MTPIYLGLGDQVPLLMFLIRDGSPVDLTAVDGVEFCVLDSAGETVVDWADVDTVQPTFTVTFDADSDRAKANGFKGQNGDQVVFATSGTLPAELTAGTAYVVRGRATNDWELTERPGGETIDLSDNGSGTHQALILGTVAVVIPEEVDEAGTYKMFVRIKGDETETFGLPNGIPLTVTATPTPP